MKRLFLTIVAATFLVASGFAAIICQDTGKGVDKCCCTVKDGKFLCSFSEKTHHKCCCESKS